MTYQEDSSVITQSAIDQEKARQERWSRGLEPATSGMPLPKPIFGERAVEVSQPSYEGQHTINDGQTRATPPGEIVKDNGQRQRRFTPLSDAMRPARDKV